jgi:hypothetical protein
VIKIFEIVSAVYFGHKLTVRECAKKLPLTAYKSMFMGYLRAATFHSPFSMGKNP